MRDPSTWSAAEAQLWHYRQPWLVGCNFTPSTAINQLEMWQEDSFDPLTIDRELGLAASVGMNTARVYLHDLLFAADPMGFLDRIDQFLTIAASHQIRTMLVLFDSCWHPRPQLGPQPDPVPGVHNSGWVQSPGEAVLADPAEQARLRTYVETVVARFGQDHRVLAWDIWNEPDNGPDVASCDPAELAAKAARVIPLLGDAFAWARAQHPSQPLTSALWLGDWSSLTLLSGIQAVQLASSDIISFHNYGGPEDFMRRVNWLRVFDRPLLCTEFMARPTGSTFEAILPEARAAGVGAICWGLVRGKTQTHLPWDSWARPYLDGPSGPWFHDIFEPDGTPHDQAEVDFLRALTRIAANDGPMRMAAAE